MKLYSGVGSQVQQGWKSSSLRIRRRMYEHLLNPSLKYSGFYTTLYSFRPNKPRYRMLDETRRMMHRKHV